ncbi:MAG: hypothetical protein IJF15_04275 [Oscillospiraceae bacterium]|nr:hypothetical protein [Oscillospiraceae bacterium]
MFVVYKKATPPIRRSRSVFKKQLREHSLSWHISFSANNANGENYRRKENSKAKLPEKEGKNNNGRQKNGVQDRDNTGSGRLHRSSVSAARHRARRRSARTTRRILFVCTSHHHGQRSFHFFFDFHDIAQEDESQCAKYPQKNALKMTNSEEYLKSPIQIDGFAAAGIFTLSLCKGWFPLINIDK